MQTSTRNRDATTGASFAARTRERGHTPHLSISDDSHHVTETIGFLYGDDDDRDRRQSLARSSKYIDSSNDADDPTNTRLTSYPRKSPVESPLLHVRPSEQLGGQRVPLTPRSFSYEQANGQPSSPIMPSREQSPSETAQARFPLNDIDYESSPAAVAQELSNLQALRRMSMDVHAAGDPDLPILNPATIPSAPSPTASDDDSARLFWVPARLHPELAPKEFKSFLESKTEQIKRRSGDLSSLGASAMSSRSASLSSNTSGLARKKSMLSREINNSQGYEDGADILERKRSMSHHHQPPDPNLAELESLVANNLKIQRPESPTDDTTDFILPSVPSSSLKRSTKTKYQRGGGGIKARGERTQRGPRRTQASDREGNTVPTPPQPDPNPLSASFFSSDSTNLADTLSFSSFQSPQNAQTSQYPSNSQNFSRPARSPSPPEENAHPSIAVNSFDSILNGSAQLDRFSTQSAPEPRHQRKHVKAPERQSVPQIIETPPADEQLLSHSPASSSRTSMESSQHLPESHQQQLPKHPERTSSRENTVSSAAGSRPAVPRTQSTINVVTTKTSRADVPPMTKPKQNLDQPSPLPGIDTNTSNLSFIPTLTVDKQNQENPKSKRSFWGGLLGKEDKEDKGKGKNSKQAQSHDNTRLDVLQTSIDGNARRRETIEIDRESLRLDEERKKESQRKASTGEKREKESFISSLFGGKKSKAEKEAKKSPRLSPDPPYRELKPDIDYDWTRFSILEERAIYRMAHIKLANPRRPLYSQVLLSNFMYSYLAKVQQMHPQMNLPTTAKQQKKQKEPQPQSQPQPQQPQVEEFSTYQRYQQQQDQHQGESSSHPQPVAYEGQYAGNGVNQPNSQPNAEVSNWSNDNSGGHSNHNSYTYHRQQQPVQQYETDREQEMW